MKKRKQIFSETQKVRTPIFHECYQYLINKQKSVDNFIAISNFIHIISE